MNLYPKYPFGIEIWLASTFLIFIVWVVFILLSWSDLYIIKTDRIQKNSNLYLSLYMMLPFFSFYIGHSSKCVGRNGCAARALAARSFRESRFRYISFYQWNRQCRRDIFQRLTQLRPRCCHGSSERDKRRLGCKPNTSENGGKDLIR